MFSKFLNIVTEATIDTVSTVASLPGRAVEITIKTPKAIVDGLEEGMERADKALTGDD